MEPENQRIAITKRLLKESLLSILKEKDLDSINVTELCRNAGINRATFYRHYQIPRDVLMDVQLDLYRELQQKIPLPKSSKEIRPVLEKLCVFMNDHLELVRIIIQSNSDTDFVHFISDVYSALIGDFSHINAMNKLSKEDQQLIMLFSAGGSYFVLRSWILDSNRRSPKEMADYIYALLKKTELMLMSTLSEHRITAQ